MNPFLDCFHCRASKTIAKLYEGGVYVRRCVRCHQRAVLPDLRPEVDSDTVIALADQGHGPQHIADVTGLSAQHVSNRLYRARKKQEVAA